MNRILVLSIAFLALIFTSCGKKSINLPDLYLAGTDTTVNVKYQTCADTTKEYTKCDGTKGMRKVSKPIEDSTQVKYRAEGPKISNDSLLALVTGSGVSSDSSKFSDYFSGMFDNFSWNWLAPILAILLLILLLVLFWGILRRLARWATGQFSHSNYHSETHNVESVTHQRRTEEPRAEQRRNTVVSERDEHNCYRTTEFWSSCNMFKPNDNIDTRKISITIDEKYKP